jgi:drug/metabolite transporter (DMT)-like permease
MEALLIVLCATLIVAGVVMIRRSRQRRGMGMTAIVLGVIGVLAWASAEHGSSPPPNATPTHGLIDTVAPTEEAP